MARNKYPEETVQKILAVSCRLFLEKGYDHTTIQDITDALGMSKGAVYHHFKSKEAILDRIYDQYYAESGLHAAALDAPGLSGLEKLRKLLLLELTDQGSCPSTRSPCPSAAIPSSFSSCSPPPSGMPAP